MTLKRLAILNLILAAGFGAVFLLPKSPGIRDSAIIATLPLQFSGWTGELEETSELVVKTLAKDTGHHRALYTKVFENLDGQLQRFGVSTFMVVSGSDMNSSIHRPERCFPAQGLTIEERKQFEIDIASQNAVIPVTMLDAVATVPEGEHKGKTYRQRAYYWFVGHTDITNNHWERTWIDMKDRVLHGYNQRWSYVMLSMNYGLEGAAGPGGEDISKVIESLIEDIYPELHKLDQIHGT